MSDRESNLEDLRRRAGGVLSRNPRSRKAARFLAYDACRCGQAGEFDRLLALLTALGDDPVTFSAQVLRQIHMDGGTETIRLIHAALDDDHVARFATTYYLGCACVAEGRHADALSHFADFSRIAGRIPDLKALARDPVPDLMLRQGLLVAPPERVRQRRAVPLPPGFAPKTVRYATRHDPGDAEVVYFSSADGRYFDIYGPQFAAGLAAVSPGAAFHIHVCLPTENLERLVADIAAAHPDLRLTVAVEDSPPLANPTFFSCNRFYVVPGLLETVRRPVVALDIDVLARPELLDIPALVAGHDVACVDTGRSEPASVYQATLQVFAPTDAAQEFLVDLQHFCAPVLIAKRFDPRSAWMIDQAALYSVLHAHAEAGGPVRFGDIARLSGRDLDHFVDRGALEAEKGEAWKQSLRESLGLAATPT